MSFGVEDLQGVTLITVHHKRATAEMAREFKDFLFDLIERKDCHKMVIDLEEVQFMDSFFLGAIVSGLKKIKSAGGDLRLASLQKSLMPVFELMHLNEVFQIYDSRLEAVTSF